MQDSANYLGTRNIFKVVLGLAIPSMLAQFVSVLYNIVDRIYISHTDFGSAALAGVGLCGPIVTLIASFGTWVGLGGAPAMSIKLGEGDHRGAQNILNNAFVLLIAFSVVLTALVYALKSNLLDWFGAGETLYPFAAEYLEWYAAGTVFAILTTGLNSFIIAQGFGKTGMISVLVGAVANIALDPLFIFTFGLGVKGAAIATVLSQMFSMLFCLRFLLGKRTVVKLGFSGISARAVSRILLLGLSPFLIIATDSVMLLALNAMLRRYGGTDGDTLIAASTIMLSFMQIVTLPLGGITGGTQPALSYNYGANNPHRVKAAQKRILGLCLIFTTVMFLIARFAARYVVLIFTTDPELIDLSIQFIRIYTLMIIPLSFQYAFVDGLTALGVAPAAIALSMTRKLVIMLTLTFVLPASYGVSAVFYAEPISDLAAGILSSVVYLCLINPLLRRRSRVCARLASNPPKE